MPFYDIDEKFIDVMISIDPKLKVEDYIIEYAFQNQSTALSMMDIYNKIISIPNATFDAKIPLNDTFIKSGNYKLVLRLKEKAKQKLLQEQDFNFQTLRKPNTYYSSNRKSGPLISKRIKNSTNNINISTTFVNKYDLNRLQQNIAALVPIAEIPEQGAMNGMIGNTNIDELRRFFYNFWYSRNPEGPEAEWKLYADKLNYCSRKFAYGSFKGYETDMGRIYLRYGAPNRTVKASNERGTKPYEIWFYSELDKHTNLNILFAQIGSLTNERAILHSSDPSFYFNPNWATQLFTDFSERLNTNSHRVYDFFN